MLAGFRLARIGVFTNGALLSEPVTPSEGEPVLRRAEGCALETEVPGIKLKRRQTFINGHGIMYTKQPSNLLLSDTSQTSVIRPVHQQY